MKRLLLIFQVAATYIGTMVGAGFATGKEVVQFFTIYGHLGTVCLIGGGVLFVWLGTKMMRMASRIKAHSYMDMNLYLLGPVFGKMFNVLYLIILLGATSVMLSGAGAVFREQLGLSPHIGILFTLLLSFLLLLNGISGVLWINSLVVPLMILFTLMLGYESLQNETFISFAVVNVGQNLDVFLATVSSFSYVAFNLMLAQAVLVPLGREIGDEQVIKWGGIVGGAVFSVLLMIIHLTILVSPETLVLDIPIGGMVAALGPLIQMAFLVVIYCEIFTTFIGNAFGLNRQISGQTELNPRLTLVGILGFTLLVSQLGYGYLVTVTYPLYGYVSLVFLFFLITHKLPARD